MNPSPSPAGDADPVDIPVRKPRAITAFLADIKIEHSLFALPFAFVGALAAQRTGQGELTMRLAALVLLAMVTARTAAMGYNRWLDAVLDAKNPRTASRAIPAGLLSPGHSLAFVVATSLLFGGASFAINAVCGLLSPIALIIILGYSTTKRWTAASHLVLGLSLALAPAGGWIAVSGTVDSPPLLLMLAVISWVAGFDILYALADLEFDRAQGLHSIPARLGEQNAYIVSRVLHATAVAALLLFGHQAVLGTGWYAATLLTAACLVTEQILARNRQRLPVAFFHMNAAIGFIMLLGLLWDLPR